MRLSGILPALCCLATACAAPLANLKSPDVSADDLTGKFDVQPAQYPKPGARAAVVSCIVATGSDESLTHRYTATQEYMQQAADAFCPHVLRALREKVPLQWVSEEEVFAVDQVSNWRATAGSLDKWSESTIGVHTSYGFYGWPHGLFGPSEDRMAEIAKALNADMVFVVGVQVFPVAGVIGVTEDWRLARIALSGWMREPPGMFSLDPPVFTLGDSWHYQYLRRGWEYQGLDVAGFEKLAEALALRFKEEMDDHND